ncbi:MAG TPA: hypothetical protein VMU63_10485, partial [Acidimicrobiales bacterium]|nr:hypothetical protein [Acidimicrobiales bacterium]
MQTEERDAQVIAALREGSGEGQMTPTVPRSGHCLASESCIERNIARLLHNYFLIKALRLTRPGGLVAVVTSRYSLDARNPAARRELDGLADLLGALRLPSGAFAASAGTDVVADLVILRRRAEGEPRAGHPFIATVPAPIEDQGPEAPFVNEYLLANPAQILGRLAVGRGLYGDNELT